MYLEDLAATRRSCGDVYVALLPHANLVAQTVDCIAQQVGMECEVVEATVSESIAVIYNDSSSVDRAEMEEYSRGKVFPTSCILDLGDQADFGQI